MDYIIASSWVTLQAETVCPLCKGAGARWWLWLETAAGPSDTLVRWPKSTNMQFVRFTLFIE